MPFNILSMRSGSSRQQPQLSSTASSSRLHPSSRMSPKVDPDVGCVIPEAGQWPIAPQEDQALRDDRLWIDGCFDFFHHGHAGVMLQSRRLGDELVVGLHSDEDIALNKGPTVMSLAERVAAVNACRFSTMCVPHAPYVTSLPWITHYGCQFVTHGDDITSDASGQDCYRFVKKAGRMKIVPRTPGISTTDLVGRMLLCTKTHFIKSLTSTLNGDEGQGGSAERVARGMEMTRLFREYAAAPNGIDPYVDVYTFKPKHRPVERRRSSVRTLPTATTTPISTTIPENSATNPISDSGKGTFTPLVTGHRPRSGQRIVYVDGGFDLFSSGHIAFLQSVTATEEALGRDRDWYTDSARQERLTRHGEDYPPAYVVAGVHDDEAINFYKGINYPIMNVFERGLCVVQCRYIHAVVFSAPSAPSRKFLESLPACAPSETTATTIRTPDVVYHGLTNSMSAASAAAAGAAAAMAASMVASDPFADAKSLGIFREIPTHEFQHVNAAQIVQRILDNRAQYEERQRKKGVKAVGEEAQRKLQAQLDEGRKAREAMRVRRQSEIERQFGA